MSYSSALFDTHYFVTQLADAGLEVEQAEAVVETLAGVFEQVVNTMLVTKDDLESENGELKELINEVRVEMLQQGQDLLDAVRVQALTTIASVTTLGVVFRLFV